MKTQVSKRTDMTRTSIILTIAVAAFYLTGSAQAQLVTSGVFDENTNETNEVDTISTESDFSSVSDFNNVLGPAFANNLGGVIHFDNVAAGTVLADNVGEDFEATYGTGQSETMTITMGAANNGDWDVGDFSGRTAISGNGTDSNMLLESTLWDFRFDTGLTDVAITVLSRDRNDPHNVTTTLLFDDNTSQVMDNNFNIPQSNGGNDTFFGYSAPTGKLITGLQVNNNGFFTGLDDLAFVVVPEPSSLALLGLGCGLLFALRRRRNA